MYQDAERLLLACSLWLRIGFVGASAVASGLLVLLSGDAQWLSALALAFFGGVLAAASFRHARTLLGDAERASAVAGVAPREQASRASSKPFGRGTIAIPPVYSAAGERESQ